MRIHRIVGSAALAACLALSPTLAVAQSCEELARKNDALRREAEITIHRNRGSATVFASCGVVGQKKYEEDGDGAAATGTFATCAGLACALTASYKNCVAVNVELFATVLQGLQIEKKMRERDC